MTCCCSLPRTGRSRGVLSTRDVPRIVAHHADAAGLLEDRRNAACPAPHVLHAFGRRRHRCGASASLPASLRSAPRHLYRERRRWSLPRQPACATHSNAPGGGSLSSLGAASVDTGTSSIAVEAGVTSLVGWRVSGFGRDGPVGAGSRRTERSCVIRLGNRFLRQRHARRDNERAPGVECSQWLGPGDSDG